MRGRATQRDRPAGRGEAKYIFAPTFCRRRLRSTPLYLYVYVRWRGGGLSGRESTPAVAIGRQGRVDRYRPGLSPRPPAVIATVFSFAAVRRVGGFPADFRRHLARHEKNGARARPANRSRALRVTVTGRTAAVPDRKCPFANAVRERAAVYTRYLSSTPFIVTYTHTYT